MIDFKECRHASINERFFDSWNEESAYVLGYIYADGCIIVTRSINDYVKYFVLDIYSKDYDLINSVCSSMKCTYKLRNRQFNRCGKTYVGFSVSISNLYLCKRLISLGVVERKSLIVEFPTFIPDEFMPDFIRGYFDGDGSVSVYPLKYAIESSFTTGSRKFADGLLKFLCCIVGVKPRFRDFGDNKFELVYSNTGSRALFGYMYKCSGDILFLKRKYARFVEGLHVEWKDYCIR